MSTCDLRQKKQRLGALGSGLSRAAAVALGAWLAWVPPSSAFHDSALDPQSKHALAGLLQELQDECRAGNRAACARAPQVQAFGNQLAQVQQACARGNQRACQLADRAQEQVAALLEQADAPGLDRYRRGQVDPETCQAARREYERCMQEARERLNADPPRFTSYEAMRAICEEGLSRCK